METLQSLQKRITTSGKLQGIVKSMKSLAAVGIRQYERAVESLDTYLAAIEQGVQVALKEAPLPVGRPGKVPVRALVVFGSDQGLCGRFNEKLAEFISRGLEQKKQSPSGLALLVVGARIGARLEAMGFSITEQFWVPSSVTGINPTIYQLLLVLEQWQKQRQVSHVDLFYNERAPATAGEPVHQVLLPLDAGKIARLSEAKWPGRNIPYYRTPAPALLSGLLRQYIFVSLFRAQAESLASEQASRLQSLQSAEKNIEEHVEELRADYRVKRQATITSELLDLVAGFKASAGGRGRTRQGEENEAAGRNFS